MNIGNRYDIEPYLEMFFKDNLWIAGCAGHELRRFKRKSDCRLYLLDSAQDEIWDIARELRILVKTLVQRWDHERSEHSETETTPE